MMCCLVAPLNAEKESKTLYSETIDRLQKKYELKYNRKINPQMVETTPTMNFNTYQLAINEDYEIFIDTLMTTMEDIKIEEINPKPKWYESKEFGFIIGVLTSVAIMHAVK